MAEKLNTMQIPFPDFTMYETIDPEEFDANNKVIQNTVNALIAGVNNYLLNVANNTPGNSYYTKNEIDSIVKLGASMQHLDGGSLHDHYVDEIGADGGSFEEKQSVTLIYDGGGF